MSQNSKKIPYSKHFFPALLPLTGQHQYSMIKKRYEELYCAVEIPKNPILHRHLVEGILPGLAYYQVLQQEGKDKQAALIKINEVFSILFFDHRKPLQTIGRLPFAYTLLRLYIRTAMKEYPPEGWDIDWKQVNRQAVRFDMKKCYYFDTLQKFSAAELTACFCAVDDLIYAEMSPHIIWDRTLTIGRGADHCNFCFRNNGFVSKE